MFNVKFLVVALAWMVSIAAWAFWRFRANPGENLPSALRWLFTLSFLVTLWGGAKLALAYTAGMQGGLAQLYAMMIFMAGFLGIFVLWHQSILGFFSRPLTSAFDGGSAQVVPKPFYSRAHALRKRGEYDAAIADIEGELANFPKDSEGWLLKADIQATDLRQPILAILTLTEFAPLAEAADRPAVLLKQADLELNALRKPETARTTLQRVSDEFPGTEVARLAQQQMAHLPTEAWLGGNPLGDRESLEVVRHEEKIGLTDDLGASRLAPDRSPEDVRQELVLALVQNPENAEARERLARLYAEDLGRPDLAQQELEQLVTARGQPEREIMRWLNLMADFHLLRPDGIADARMALNRLIERFPESPAAEVAARRLTLLKLEAVAPETPTLHLGPPTGNLGLETERRFSARRANLPGLLPEPDEPA